MRFFALCVATVAAVRLTNAPQDDPKKKKGGEEVNFAAGDGGDDEPKKKKKGGEEVNFAAGDGDDGSKKDEPKEKETFLQMTNAPQDDPKKKKGGEEVNFAAGDGGDDEPKKKKKGGEEVNFAAGDDDEPEKKDDKEVNFAGDGDDDKPKKKKGENETTLLQMKMTTRRTKMPHDEGFSRSWDQSLEDDDGELDIHRVEDMSNEVDTNHYAGENEHREQINEQVTHWHQSNEHPKVIRAKRHWSNDDLW